MPAFATAVLACKWEGRWWADLQDLVASAPAAVREDRWGAEGAALQQLGGEGQAQAEEHRQQQGQGAAQAVAAEVAPPLQGFCLCDWDAQRLVQLPRHICHTCSRQGII